ncbi:MAG TPA: hypothetical protein VFD92_14135 [Candidatus Binatia bacterium]|nr:hypothetical protein [Candidatus Binatia bacterium]
MQNRPCARRTASRERSPLAISLLAAAAVAAIAASAPARAADHCSVRVDRRDGTLLLTAAHVTGTLRWGTTLGQESTPVFDAATCTTPTGRAVRCTLGDVGTPERTTVPDGCTVFLADDGPTRCAAYVAKCRPIPPPIACQMFPANNVWNRDVSGLPPHPLSDDYVASIGMSAPLHPDFGGALYRNAPIGIPYTVVPSIQPLVPISFLYDDESDPGPYPLPPFAPVEGGAKPGVGKGDAHVLVVETGSCTLWEVYAAKSHVKGASWSAGSGAVFDLTSNALRPAGWTSADAAGLPILPGLVRWDETEAGVIAHAIRFTAPRTQSAYVWPARHEASSSSDPALPPMGVRFRLKSTFNVSSFSPRNQVILTALKTYGMILADNGSSWFISGTPDPRWDDDELNELKTLHGSDFEAVDTSSLIVDPDSGATP